MSQTLFPALRYKDAHAAIDWLCNAFGFERHAVYESDGNVDHAELRFGDSMLMLGSARPDTNLRMLPPAEAGEVTATIYVAVTNVDAHHDRARSAGANIVRPLTDQDYGSRDYSCLDPEGNLWSFGTYVPQMEVAPVK